LTVCCQAGTAEEALSEIPKCSPDLVITDMTMPGRGGLEFIKDVKAICPNLPVLVVSMHDEMLHAERALRAGARGYLMKEVDGEKMLEAIRKVLTGQVYVSEKMSARILDNLSGRKPRGSTSPIEKLSDREFEVFRAPWAKRMAAAQVNQIKWWHWTSQTHYQPGQDHLPGLQCAHGHQRAVGAGDFG